MTTSILRLPAVKARTGLSRSSIYAKIASGDFPAPVRLGDSEKTRAIGFIESEIEEWISRRQRIRSPIAPSHHG